MNLKCIVIDDEPLALRQMQVYISKVPFLELAGCFNNALHNRAILHSVSLYSL